MDNRKISLALFLAAAILAWIITRSGIQYLFVAFYQVRRFPGILVLREAVPLLVGTAVFVGLYVNSHVNQVLAEVTSELKKVTWPNREDVVKSTTVVIICVLIASVILAGFDLIWGKLMSYLLNG